MFRDMRRKNQLLSQEESIKILAGGTSGVLALYGDKEYPYAVPMSYVYHDGKIYFHGARQGHKVDAIKNHHKASFCVISQDMVVPQEYTTYFGSVIAFGRIDIITDKQEEQEALEILADKYYPQDFLEHRQKMIEDYKAICMIKLDIEHLTGKVAKELVKEKSLL